MSFLDDAKKKLGDAVDKHGPKISEGLDKAGRAINEKTGGKYRTQVGSGVGQAKESLDGLDGKRDDLPASSTPTPTRAGGGDPNPIPTDPSPVPPEPGAQPNEEIASGDRPVPSGGA